MARRSTVWTLAKVAVFCVGLLPLAWLVWAAFENRLGVNPIETVTHETGDWALRALVATLAITPVRMLTGWNDVARFRRMLGLFAFFYASLHLLTYVWFDQFFSWSDIARDIPKRPFITVGFFAFLLLVPLAVTSTDGWIRRLGGRTWRALHRLAYVAAVAGVVHYWWLVKADITGPLAYATVLAVLLLARVLMTARRRVAAKRVAATRVVP